MRTMLLLLTLLVGAISVAPVLPAQAAGARIDGNGAP